MLGHAIIWTIMYHSKTNIVNQNLNFLSSQRMLFCSNLILWYEIQSMGPWFRFLAHWGSTPDVLLYQSYCTCRQCALSLWCRLKYFTLNSIETTPVWTSRNLFFGYQWMQPFIQSTEIRPEFYSISKFGWYQLYT